MSGERISPTALQQTSLHARLHLGYSSPSSCLASPFSSPPMIVHLNEGTNTVLPVAVSDTYTTLAPPPRKVSDGTTSFVPTAACFENMVNFWHSLMDIGIILIHGLRRFLQLCCSFVDENRTVDMFPAGIRVLAVDDDPICLKLLDNLLRKLQYHVTITSQAIKALQMLRENRNRFDLVITDVNMPDMDGFKFLEQVGIEMNLPVIILVAHSDTNLVMKGLTHGAVDYLLKPVRIEQLKNIWQYVIRTQREKIDSSNQNKAPSREVSSVIIIANNADQNWESSKKLKDQNEDEDEDPEESGPESDDPLTQKKPRVVWSVELHRKFVDSVKQLGFEKAVPKKILDLMKVEGLTRENVASHLQKYRLYLQRIHTEKKNDMHICLLH